MSRKPQITLGPGDNRLPIAGAIAHVWEVGGEARVMVVVDGRDRGAWSGTLASCEMWLEGWIHGRVASGARDRAIAIECVYAARDPKWAGGDAEVDAIIAKHR